jgi:hypothetical protein
MEFVVAHELLHSPQKSDRRMASLALMPLAYSHWVVSHIAHHAKVERNVQHTSLTWCTPALRRETDTFCFL